MNQSIGEIIFDDIGLALQVANDPAVTAAIASVSPIAAALMKFLPVIIPAVKGVETIVLADQKGNPAPSGATPVPPAAITAVANHNTPGQPNVPELGPQAPAHAS